MQSFLAYRRFERKVREQYDRDRKRAEALDRGNASHTSSPPENEEAEAHRHSSIDDLSSETEVPYPNHSPDDTRDPENAEQPGGKEDNGEASSHPDQDELEQRNTVSRSHTNQSFGTRMGHAMTGIEVRELSEQLTKRRSEAGKGKKEGKKPEKDGPTKEKVFVVSFESSKDPMNPHNWGLGKRIGCTILIAAIGFIVGFASSIDSAALTQASEEFGVGEVTESLATGLFLVGFGFGALFAGPISETVGRNPVYIVTLAIYMIWIMASALAPNIGAQLVFRFLAGFFGSTPLTCAGGSISDLWDPMERVFAFPVFAK